TEIQGRIVPLLGKNADEGVANAGESNVGVNLVEADFDVPQPDLPASLNVVLVVNSRKESGQPTSQRSFESLHLRLAADDDLGSGRMPFDFRIKVINDGRDFRLDEWRDGPNSLGVLRSPADVSLQILIALVQLLGFHGPIVVDTRDVNKRLCAWACGRDEFARGM